LGSTPESDKFHSNYKALVDVFRVQQEFKESQVVLENPDLWVLKEKWAFLGPVERGETRDSKENKELQVSCLYLLLYASILVNRNINLK